MQTGWVLWTLRLGVQGGNPSVRASSGPPAQGTHVACSPELLCAGQGGEKVGYDGRAPSIRGLGVECRERTGD